MASNYKVFLDIALDDVSASKILLKKKFYPQAVFYFGQSIEKTCKYLLIKDGILSVDQLNSRIKHDASKVFTIFTDHLINKLSSAVDTEKIVKSNNDHLLFNVLNPIDFINDLKSGIKVFEDSKNKLNELDDKKIDQYMNMLKIFNSNILSDNKYNNFYKSDPRVLVDWLLEFHIVDEQTKIDLKEKLKDDNFKIQFYADIKKYLLSIHEYMRVQQILMVLAILFSSCAVDTRYPDNTLNHLPVTRYNSSSMLIRRLKELYKYLEKSINFLKAN
ncbi:MAG: HEPN domain-containing protein [Bacteroidia bacterium]|nr:HEPN domain-containing protein [Bacteroidia bacterium]